MQHTFPFFSIVMNFTDNNLLTLTAVMEEIRLLQNVIMRLKAELFASRQQSKVMKEQLNKFIYSYKMFIGQEQTGGPVFRATVITPPQQKTYTNIAGKFVLPPRRANLITLAINPATICKRTACIIFNSHLSNTADYANLRKIINYTLISKIGTKAPLVVPSFVLAHSLLSLTKPLPVMANDFIKNKKKSSK